MKMIPGHVPLGSLPRSHVKYQRWKAKAIQVQSRLSRYNTLTRRSKPYRLYFGQLFSSAKEAPANLFNGLISQGTQGCCEKQAVLFQALVLARPGLFFLALAVWPTEMLCHKDELQTHHSLAKPVLVIQKPVLVLRTQQPQEHIPVLTAKPRSVLNMEDSMPAHRPCL